MGGELRAGGCPLPHLLLQTVDTGRQRLAVEGGFGTGEADQGQLEDQTFLSSLAKVKQGFRESVDRSQDIGWRQDATLPPPLIENLRGLVGDLLEIRRILGKEDPAEEAKGVGDEAPQVGGAGGKLGNEAECSRGMLLGDGCDEPGECVTVGEAERASDSLG